MYVSWLLDQTKPSSHQLHDVCVMAAGSDLASSPGSNAGAGGKREPGIHCLCMHQKYNVNDATSPYVTRL